VRITQNMMATNVINNMQNDYQALQTSQNQLDTGLAVTQPSDNPQATDQIMALNTNISMQGIYYTNMQTANSNLSITSSALNNLVSDLQQIRTATVQGANGTNIDTDLQNLGQQVNQIIGNIVQIGNTTNGTDDYAFGGTQTTTAPLATQTGGDGTISQVTYSGNSGQLNYEVAQGVKVPANVNGTDLFQVTAAAGSGNSTMFNTLIAIKDDMMNGDTTNLSSMLNQLDNVIGNVENQQAAVGAIQDRLTEAMTMNQNDTTSMTTVLSNLQDVDVDQATVEFNERSNVYQAALDAAAKAITPTLAEYLPT